MLIVPYCVSLFTRLGISLENMDQIFEKKNQQPSNENKNIPLDETDQKIITEYKNEHYKKWLTMPLSALNGKTPMEMSKTKKGKEKLISLLKLMENYESRYSDGDYYNFNWLWDELGIKKEEVVLS